MGASRNAAFGRTLDKLDGMTAVIGKTLLVPVPRVYAAGGVVNRDDGGDRGASEGGLRGGLGNGPNCG